MTTMQPPKGLFILLTHEYIIFQNCFHLKFTSIIEIYFPSERTSPLRGRNPTSFVNYETTQTWI